MNGLKVFNRQGWEAVTKGLVGRQSSGANVHIRVRLYKHVADADTLGKDPRRSSFGLEEYCE